MAVGRLQAALAAATSEVTVAAANLNFDFTLVKYEAPKEYQALGTVLSSKRKDNAEYGSSHVTARRLGALFEGVCPPASSLLEAYGTRASEIAKASKSTSDPYVNTLFAEHIGIDGTSIWAAATSSKAALHVHLLACMLARMWTASEAVAIWVELVSERKRDIADRFDADDGVKFSLAAAVGQEITRPQLAAWDASARAWLRTADSVQERNQKQLEIILKNLNVPINADSTVFPSVTKAWKTAVQAMDRLVAGMPQEAGSGAILLGLSAWHLYPDINVFGSQIVPVRMHDPLMNRGGLLSLGLSASPHTVSGGNGVYWSLSLAHLRHYGRPVRSEGVIQSTSRISFPQLNLVFVSAFLAQWGLSEKNIELAAKAVLGLASCLRGKAQSKSDKKSLELLQEGASAFLDRSSGENELNHKLIQLGRRRAPLLFPVAAESSVVTTGHPILFNLLDPKDFMKALRDREARLAALRHIATQLGKDGVSPDIFIIRYKHETLQASPVKETLLSNDSHHPNADGDNHSPAPVPNPDEILSSPPFDNLEDEYSKDGNTSDEKASGKDTRNDTGKTIAEEDSIGYATDKNLEEENRKDGNWEDKYSEQDYDDYESSYEDDDSENGQSDQSAEVFQHVEYAFATALPLNSPLNGRPHSQLHHYHHRWLPGIPENPFCVSGESYTLDAEERFESWEDRIEIVGTKDISYGYLLGTSEAALYSRRGPEFGIYDATITLESFLWCLENNLFDADILFKAVLRPGQVMTDWLRKTLFALAYAARIYDDMPEATIDVGILSRPLLDCDWAQTEKYEFDSRMLNFSYQRIFSLIAYFESGLHNISPGSLANVIALSSTNSLFVSLSMIQDPSKSFGSEPKVRRILGNVGKPGLSFLLPPQEPMTREVSSNSWRVDSYRPFDGSSAQSFRSTSMHLSFTEFHAQMYDGSRGAQDNQISYLESVISVRDRGVWVADIDPLPLLGWADTNIDFLGIQFPCDHPKHSNHNSEITAVDSWDELLDPPAGIFVVRTGGNWLARLALTMVARQQLQKTGKPYAVTVCPDTVCWTCVQQNFVHHAYIF
jgi:hypothetical protein